MADENAAPVYDPTRTGHGTERERASEPRNGAVGLRQLLDRALSDERLPPAVLLVLGLAVAALILYVGRETILFYDDWGFVFERRRTTLDGLLEPHFGHLVLVPSLVYKALFETIGLQPYWPYRIVPVVLHLACAWLLYCVARRRLGAWPAASMGGLLLFLGSAWEVLLWPFTIAYTIPLAAGLGSWLLLQRRGLGREISASLLVALGLASSALGLPVALGILTRFLTDPAERQRAWVAAVPIAFFGLWYVIYGRGETGGLSASNLPDIPQYMAEMAGAAAGGASGLGSNWGRLVFALLAIAIVWQLLRHGVSPWLAAGLVMLGAFWTLTALSRVDFGVPASSRYVYVSVVFLLLIITELPRDGIGVAGSQKWPKRAWVLAGVAIAVAFLGNMAELRNGGRHLRTASANVVPALIALEIGGDAIPGNHKPELRYAPQVAADEYLQATRTLGSAVPTSHRNELARPAVAAAVDRKLAAAEGLALAEARPGAELGASPPPVALAIRGGIRRTSGCLRFTPTGTPSGVDVRLPPREELVFRNRGRAPSELRLRRFGDSYPDEALGVVPPRTARRLSVPGDRSPAPWIARVSAAGPVDVCSG